MRDRQMKKVMALLDAENAIIRRGDLASLPNIAEQKALLLGDIHQFRMSADELVTLKAAAERNARLLTAAMAGVKDAQKRLIALDEMRAGLSIYDAQGKRETVAGPRNAFEKKA